MIRTLMVVAALALACSSAAAQPTSTAQGTSRAVWTVSGAGIGFGIGLWAGLSAFDDAVNSDRKVWTSAIVGAGAGAVAGYLIARARESPRPAVHRIAGDRRSSVRREQQLLLRLARSVTLRRVDAGRSDRADGWRTR